MVVLVPFLAFCSSASISPGFAVMVLVVPFWLRIKICFGTVAYLTNRYNTGYIAKTKRAKRYLRATLLIYLGWIARL
ncbi:hypothetical protein F4860DRAFT_483564 [Xylaria cubensis]|nr:hypothetical protein F4860DRAFT_483564 [Xylaria cubensis]